MVTARPFLPPPAAMDFDQFRDVFAAAVHEFLLWIGFGTVVGLCAKALMPGRDPGGAIATTLMGIVGSVIGCGVLIFTLEQLDRRHGPITPISPVGFAAGCGGAFVLLLFYRLFSGRLLTESEDGERLMAAADRTRRRRKLVS